MKREGEVSSYNKTKIPIIYVKQNKQKKTFSVFNRNICSVQYYVGNLEFLPSDIYRFCKTNLSLVLNLVT